MIPEIISQVTTFAKSNPFISGGLLVGLGSFGMNIVRGLPSKLVTNINDFLFMSVRIVKGTDLFTYVDDYIVYEKINIKHGIARLDTVNNQPKICPYDGKIKSFLFKNSWVRITKEMPEKQNQGSGGRFPYGGGGGFISELTKLAKPECYVLQFLTFDRTIPLQFLKFLVNHNKAQQNELIRVQYNDGDYWEDLLKVAPRTMGSVLLDHDIHQEILADIRRFEDRKDWYFEVGLPYHRGYLLYGPPGAGKSSSVHAIASILHRKVCILDLSTVKHNKELVKLFSTIDESSIVLLEDVDCAFQSDRKGVSEITYSGLLNALDGLCTPPGLITFFTTNHKELLDPALFRPGRVDQSYYFANANRKQIYDLYLKLFGTDYEPLAMDFCKSIPEHEFSMAAIQEYLLQYLDQPDKALINLAKLTK